MPKVSVIVPVYNVEKYLCQCLDSLVNQTLQDIEIICINDGSTDGSPDILEKYAKKDSRITVINQKNQGVAVARNEGLAVACGAYIGFCDPDDWVDFDFFEKLFLAADNGKFDIVKGNFNIVYDSGKTQNTEEINNIKDELNTNNIPLKTFVTSWWSAIYRTDFLNKYKIVFPQLAYKEDVAFLYKTLSAAENFKVVDDVFYHYFKRKGSLTDQKLTHEKFRDYIASRSDVCDFLNKNIDNEEKYTRFFKYKVVQALLNDLKIIQKSCNLDEFSYYCDIANGIIDNCKYKTIEKSFDENLFFNFLRKKNYSRLYIAFSRNQKLKILQQIFSIRNVGEYKCLTLIGVPFVFKRKVHG